MSSITSARLAGACVGALLAASAPGVFAQAPSPLAQKAGPHAKPVKARSEAPPASGAPSKEASFADAIKGLEAKPGLLPLYLDAKGGRVLIALQPGSNGDCGRFIYQVDMRAGLGSTPIGIDRSQPSRTEILAFKRVGKRIIAELENTRFRAGDGNPDEVDAVRESFPASTLWSGPIIAAREDGAVLIDISSFLTRDAFGVSGALKRAKEGAYKLSETLSYPDVAAAAAFPENLEFDAHETFVSEDAGPELRAIAPDPHSVTVVEHHSLVKLPPPGYVPREADNRTGTFSTLVADYGTPLGASTVVRLAHRFRLEKTDPAAARSPVKKPIIFYVDRAAPEPVRSALREGAQWWSQAFDAAGFIDAFKVEILPEGVSPLDVRYNVINWVHRQTRGWSYGANIIDPRTGEIIKGSVLLGSLRVRQDRMIFEGLERADKTGAGGPNDPLQISLARLRQLAVHETGHALGFSHNFAASTYDDRASVMDYPPPRVGVKDGALDFADAYKVGVGTWDKFVVKWLYAEVPDGEAGKAALDRIVSDGYAAGLKYVSDEDSRPRGSAEPSGSLWDDGPDAVEGLKHALEVRRIALSTFGVRNLPKGAPISDLRRIIVPIYLFHRYEIDAASKLIGGIDFTYAVKGDPRDEARPVSPEAQRRALDAILQSLSPETLDLPTPLLNLLAEGRDSPEDKAFDIEVFGKPGAPGFDLGDAADAAVDIALGDILDAERLNRVAEQGSSEAQGLTLSELIGRVIAATYPQPASGSAHLGELRRRIGARAVVRLASALEDPMLNPTAASAVRAGLVDLATRLSAQKEGDKEEIAQARYFADLILNPSRDGIAALAALDAKHGREPPPGMPIGAGEDEGFGEDGWFSEPLSASR